MRKSLVSEEQIIGILNDHQASVGAQPDHSELKERRDLREQDTVKL